jgi:hypothetical protein
MQTEKIGSYVLPRGRLQQGEFARVVHCATIPQGVPYKQVLEPGFWSLVQRTIRAGDKIEVVDEGGSYYGELYVQGVGVNQLFVKQIAYIEFEGEIKTEPEDPFEIVWAGPSARFRVIDRHTGNVIQEKLKDKKAAYDWAADHYKAMAR